MSLSVQSQYFHIITFFSYSQFDLYSKTDEVPDIEELKPYYQTLVDKYMPGKIKFWLWCESLVALLLDVFHDDNLCRRSDLSSFFGNIITLFYSCYNANGQIYAIILAMYTLTEQFSPNITTVCLVNMNNIYRDACKNRNLIIYQFDLIFSCGQYFMEFCIAKYIKSIFSIRW